MTSFRIALATLGGCVVLLTSGHAQASGSALTLGLFERYVDALRLEFGLPGLTVAVVEDGRVWERAFGSSDVGANIAATPATPFPVMGLTQTISSVLVLDRCVESGRAELGDRVVRWTPFADASTTVRNLLTHTSGNGGYRFDLSRYAVLADVAAECVNEEFDSLLAEDILDRFSMIDSVPGRDVLDAARRTRFSSSQLDRYSNALGRMALPYRLDARKSPSRSDYAASGISASTGLIASARDLARFDTALMDEGVLLTDQSLTLSWNSAPGTSTGLGWFVQTYNGQRIAWQFGLAPDAYSSLVVKIPDRRITLILLANADGLTSGLSTQTPDVTQSVFARTFLRLFIS